MPYRIKGKTVVKKGSGKVVGYSKNPKKYKKVLDAVDHGWKPDGNGNMNRKKRHMRFV